MRHHQPQSPILCFEKHSALHWHWLWCTKEGVVMQVACLCVYQIVHLLSKNSLERKHPETWNAMQKPRRKYSVEFWIQYLYSSFSGLLHYGVFIWRTNLVGQDRHPGNIHVIIKTDYYVHTVKEKGNWPCHLREEKRFLGAMGDGQNPGWPFKEFSQFLSYTVSFFLCLFCFKFHYQF